MSDTNRVGLRFVKETSPGETPTTPTFRELPTSSQSNLGFTPKTEKSKLLADDRKTRDLILVGGEVGGDANSEFAFGIHDEMLEAAMFDAWQIRYAKNNRGTDQITAVNASTDDFVVTEDVTFTGTVDFSGTTTDRITRASGSFITDGFEVGMYALVSGAVDGGNNAVFLITEVTALYMVLSGLPADETADTGVTISQVLPEGAIIRAEGFGEDANNEFFVVQAGTTATSIVTPAGRADETPGINARIHLVGFQAEAADIVATADGFTSTLFDFRALQLEAGDWLYVTGTGGTWPVTNVGYGRIASVTANEIVWDLSPASWATNDGVGATVSFYLGDRLSDGVDVTTFSLERSFNDHSPVTYQYLRGMEVGKATIVAASQAVVECNLSFVGRSAEFTETRFTGAVSEDQESFSVLNSSSNVGRIARDGEVLTGTATKNLVTQLSVEIENNLRRRNAVSFIGASSVGAGECAISGSLDCYFDDKTIAEQIVNNEETSVDARFVDGEQHVMLFDLPRIKYSEGYPAVGGKNEDVSIAAKFTALKHADFAYQMKLQRFYGVDV